MSRAPSFVPARKVVPGAEMANVTQGVLYVEQARKYLEETAQRTQQEIEDARKKGYEDGFAEGRREALASITPILQEIRAKLDLSEADLASIIVLCLEKIIGQFESRELIYRVLRTALREMSTSYGLILRVAPDDFDAVQNDVGHLEAREGSATIRKVEIDPLLHKGEMVFETPRGRMHVGVHHQFSRLKAAMGVSNAELADTKFATAGFSSKSL